MNIGIDYTTAFAETPDLFRSIISTIREAGHTPILIARACDEDTLQTVDTCHVTILFVPEARDRYGVADDAGIPIDIWVGRHLGDIARGSEGDRRRIAMLEHELEIALRDINERHARELAGGDSPQCTGPNMPPEARPPRGTEAIRTALDILRHPQNDLNEVWLCDKHGVTIQYVEEHGWYIVDLDHRYLRADTAGWEDHCTNGWFPSYGAALEAYRICDIHEVRDVARETDDTVPEMEQVREAPEIEQPRRVVPPPTVIRDVAEPTNTNITDWQRTRGMTVTNEQITGRQPLLNAAPNPNRNRRIYRDMVGERTATDRDAALHTDLEQNTTAHTTYVDEQGRMRLQRGNRPRNGDPVIERDTERTPLRGETIRMHYIDDIQFTPEHGQRIDFRHVEEPTLPDPPEGYVGRLQEGVAIHEAIEAREALTAQDGQDTPE